MLQVHPFQRYRLVGASARLRLEHRRHGSSSRSRRLRQADHEDLHRRRMQPRRPEAGVPADCERQLRGPQHHLPPEPKDQIRGQGGYGRKSSLPREAGALRYGGEQLPVRREDRLERTRGGRESGPGKAVVHNYAANVIRPPSYSLTDGKIAFRAEICANLTENLKIIGKNRMLLVLFSLRIA